MKCALCKTNEADKKNTHYLTDGIIRSCLNQEGENEREKGFYFDLSNNSATVEFNFQRGTSINKIETALDRQVTDEESDKAKKTPFAIDYVFCSGCENIFTQIESRFIETILPKLRNEDLDKMVEIDFKEIKLIRLFFYIQVWRTSVCERIFQLSEDCTDKLRQIILNNASIEEKDIKHFPLSITYLNTIGSEKEYTRNCVGFTNDQNPNVILFNDFIIQFFESNNSVGFLDFYGLNIQENYENYINCEEDTFKIKILKNDERIELYSKFMHGEKGKYLRTTYRECFIKLWKKVFGGNPSQKLVEDYVDTIIDQELTILKYSADNIAKLTRDFIISRTNVSSNKDSYQKLP